MNVENGTVAAKFPEKDYLFRIFGIFSVQCPKKYSLSITRTFVRADVQILYFIYFMFRKICYLNLFRVTLSVPA
jgi:hypothetical protein